tara:strand:- start:356 stop:1117 length:762 start_codon:yes stop_codon:yes gene_type:complete
MAAATAIIGTTLAVGQAGMSFAQASKQAKAQKKAEQAAEDAMKAARAKLEENVYEGLDINLKSFERERDALAGIGAQLVQAGQESDRGAAATAGRVAMAAAEQATNIQDREIDALEALEQTVAAEEAKLQQARVGLDLGEAEGAQLAARDAQEAKNAAITQGVQGLASAGLGLMESADLFANSPEAIQKRQAARLSRRVESGKVLPSGVKVNQGALQDMLRGGGIDGSADALSKGGLQNIFSGVSGLFRKKGN